MSHTKGQWKCEDFAVLGKAFNGEWKIICHPVHGQTLDEAVSNARRIVLCVNYCAGMSDAQLIALTATQ